MLMRRRPLNLGGQLIRPADWLADEHAQRDLERESTPNPRPRTIRAPHNPHHARGARQLAILGRVMGTGTDGDS